MKSMRSLYKKLFHYVPDKRILAYFSMALSAAAVCSYMGAYWFLWQSIVSILVIPVYEKAMYDAIIVVILMILRGILNIASATCSHYLGFRLETNLRKNGLHKLLDASSSFFDHNSSGEIRKIIDDNAAETHKTVAHLIPDNVTAVMTPVLMFVLMFAIDYRLGILLILTTVIGVLQYRKMSGGTEFLSGYSAALQKMSAATVEYAVNQQELETSVFDGLETAAETLFTNEKPNCGVEVKTYPTDMEKAKQLMKEAGYEDTNDDGILEKDGTSLAIHFNYSQSLASVDNAVLSIAASLKELGFDVTIDAVDMNTWYGALMAGEYDLTFYNTAGGSFDPATDMSNMAPGAMGDPILCQFSAFFENPEIFAELDSTSDSQRVQEIYGMILNGIADQNLLVPVTGTHDLALWNTDKITGYDFYTDASYVDIASVHVK